MSIPAHLRLNLLAPSLMTNVSTLVTGAIQDGVFPAGAVAVIQGDHVLLDASWGWLDPEDKQDLTPDDLFDLASVTKLFTTTAFLAQVSAGKVSLNTPLVDVIPAFGHPSPRPIDGGQDPHSKQHLPTPAQYQGQHVDPAKVTFWHLLTHTSGLPPWRAVFNAAGPAPPPPNAPDTVSRAERWQNALDALCNYPFVGQPDEKIVRYSDVGLMLLGEATARLHGKPLDETIYDHIPFKFWPDARFVFNPVRSGHLKREQTVPTEIDATWRKRRVWGEVHDENACGVGGVAGHAGLFANAKSIALFGHAWMNRPDRHFGVELALAKQAIREQAVSAGQRRGLGFVLRGLEDSSASERFSANTYGHTGFTGTSLWIDPDAQLVVACLTNRVYPGRDKPGIHAFRQALHRLLADAAATSTASG